MTSCACVWPKQYGSPSVSWFIVNVPVLVRAQHVGAGQFLDRGQPGNDGLFGSEQPCANRHGHRQHRRQRHRYGRNRQHQGELQGAQQGIAAEQRDQHDDRDKGQRQHDEIIADLLDGALKVALGALFLDELGGVAKKGLKAGGVYKTVEFTRADDRA